MGGYGGGGARWGGERAKGSALPYEGEKGALGIAEVGWTERSGIVGFAGLWWWWRCCYVGCGLRGAALMVVWRFLYYGCLDWRVSYSWLFALVYARWCPRTPFGESEGYLYVERRHVQNTLIKLLQGFQFQTQCRAEYENRMPICPFRHPFLFSLTHHFLAPLSYLMRPHLRSRNSIAVEAIVDVGGVPRISRLNVARDGDRQGPAAAACQLNLHARDVELWRRARVVDCQSFDAY